MPSPDAGLTGRVSLVGRCRNGVSRHRTPRRLPGASARVATGFFGGLLGGGFAVAVTVGGLALAGALPAIQNQSGSARAVAPATVIAARAPRELPARSIYLRAAPAVVAINAFGASAPATPDEYLNGEGGGQGTATGSGFEVDARGDILTNWHVVQGASRVSVALSEHGKPQEAVVVDRDPAHDLALLRVPAAHASLDPLSLARASTAQVGEPVLAIGNPFGYGRTITNGIVSALGRAIQAPSGATIADAIQTDAPIDPGSSGGPLLNMRGEVIGINSQIVTSGASGGYVGISFAISISAVWRDLRVWGIQP
jgi:S1-C subfamily serine protease